MNCRWAEGALQPYMSVQPPDLAVSLHPKHIPWVNLPFCEELILSKPLAGVYVFDPKLCLYSSLGDRAYSLTLSTGHACCERGEVKRAKVDSMFQQIKMWLPFLG